VKYKKSRSRDLIRDMLDHTVDHPTAHELFDRMRPDFPRLSLATVYRNLGILVEQGAIARVELKGNPERYESRMEPHYHLICENCGAVRDVPVSVDDELDTRVEAATDCRVTRHEIQFFGLCESCS